MTMKSFSASLDHLHEMLSFIRAAAKRANFNSMDLYKIELAAEESIVNVIHYSYNDKQGKIEIIVETKPTVFQITIIDSGRAFNPIAKKPKLSSTDLEKREVGGLGIHFIRQCMDEVSYQRANEQNVLTLIKKLH